MASGMYVMYIILITVIKMHLSRLNELYFSEWVFCMHAACKLDYAYHNAWFDAEFIYCVYKFIS